LFILEQEAKERVAYIRSMEAENVRLGKECEFLKQKMELSQKETAKWKTDSERLDLHVRGMQGLFFKKSLRAVRLSIH
jgi:hypothetical protein